MIAPERIWIDAWGGNWSPTVGGTQEHEYIRADLARRDPYATALQRYDLEQAMTQIEQGEAALFDLCLSHGMPKSGLPMEWLNIRLSAAIVPAQIRADALREAAEIKMPYFDVDGNKTMRGLPFRTKRTILALIDKPKGGAA